MRVLLISENRCLDNLIPFPLGIACVASAARQAGHEVSCLDLMFSRDPVEHVLKEETAAPIVLGGAGFTIFPRECLESFDLEMGIVGEGERAFVELLERLRAGVSLEDLPGLALRRDGAARVNLPSPHAWPGLYPPPERDLFDVTRYNWTPGKLPPYVANLQARRGCHLRCIYCTNPTVEGRAMRVRDPAAVADVLASLENDYGIGYAVFVDSLFNYPVEYTQELCREIRSRELSLKWYCILNPLYCEAKLLEALREAGCAGLSIGNESGRRHSALPQEGLHNG